jgi:serine-type D-Ala-D-Ala carboxypeptidase/endopeptidase (penicillin-binding protein 4)
MIKKYIIIGALLCHAALANQKLLGNTFVGYKIENVVSKQVLSKHNSANSFTPASVNKLFVSLASLETLGAKHRYSDTISQDKTSNVIFNMQQDPSFTHLDLYHLLYSLKDKTIHGNFIISANDHNFLAYPPGWLFDDISFGFATAITPYLLDQGRFKLLLKAANNIQLATDIPADVIKFDNKLVENINSKTCKVAVYRNAQGFILRGCMQGGKNQTQYVMRTLAILDQQKYLRYWIKKYMRQLHIKLVGKIDFRQHASGKKIIARHHSPTLKLQLQHLLAKSDNVYAEAFLKELGRQTKAPGISDFQSGTNAVRKILLKTNAINMHGLRYDDGSGLSRYNATSPNILTQLLIAAYNSKLKTTWLDILAEPGNNNTVRMLNLKLPKDIILHAKTGSMTGVLSLAGYMQAKGHQAVAFSIFINGITNKRASRRWLKNWLDHKVQHIARQQAKTHYKMPHQHLAKKSIHIKWNKVL